MNRIFLVGPVLLLAGCAAQMNVTRYGASLPASTKVEVFHAAPTNAYTEVGEIAQEATTEPTTAMVEQAKALGADGLYFLSPQPTGRFTPLSAGRLAYRYRAIAIKFK